MNICVGEQTISLFPQVKVQLRDKRKTEVIGRHVWAANKSTEADKSIHCRYCLFEYPQVFSDS